MLSSEKLPRYEGLRLMGSAETLREFQPYPIQKALVRLAFLRFC